MLPTRLDFAIKICPRLTAMMPTLRKPSTLDRQKWSKLLELQDLTIISTTLHKDAFMSPPKTCPAPAESSSIAKDIKGASGIRAKILRKKTASTGQQRNPAVIPIGTKTKSTS